MQSERAYWVLQWVFTFENQKQWFNQTIESGQSLPLIWVLYRGSLEYLPKGDRVLTGLWSGSDNSLLEKWGAKPRSLEAEVSASELFIREQLSCLVMLQAREINHAKTGRKVTGYGTSFKIRTGTRENTNRMYLSVPNPPGCSLFLNLALCIQTLTFVKTKTHIVHVFRGPSMNT